MKDTDLKNLQNNFDDWSLMDLNPSVIAKVQDQLT